MTYPLPPIGPRPHDGVAPVERVGRDRPVDRRREREQGEQQGKQHPDRPAYDPSATPDDDGHIDVLA